MVLPTGCTGNPLVDAYNFIEANDTNDDGALSGPEEEESITLLQCEGFIGFSENGVDLPQLTRALPGMFRSEYPMIHSLNGFLSRRRGGENYSDVLEGIAQDLCAIRDNPQFPFAENNVVEHLMYSLRLIRNSPDGYQPELERIVASVILQLPPDSQIFSQENIVSTQSLMSFMGEIAVAIARETLDSQNVTLEEKLSILSQIFRLFSENQAAEILCMATDNGNSNIRAEAIQILLSTTLLQNTTSEALIGIFPSINNEAGRIAVIDSLSENRRICSPTVVDPFLIGVLTGNGRDSSPQVRAAVVRFLASNNPGANSTQALLLALRDTSDEVRISAALALFRSDSDNQSATEALAIINSADYNNANIRGAIRRLLEIQPGIFSVVLNCENISEDIKIAFIESLRGTRDNWALGFLAEALTRYQSIPLRTAATRALTPYPPEEIYMRRFLFVLPPLIPELITLALRSPDQPESVRYELLDAAATVLGISVIETELTEALNSPSDRIRARAAILLVGGIPNFPNEQAARIVEDVAAGRLTPELQHRAAFVLARRESPNVLSALELALRNANPEIRREALFYIDTYLQNDQRTTGLAVDMLEDSSPLVRSEAMLSIERINERSPLPLEILIQILSSNDAEIRSRARQIIIQRGVAAIPELFEAAANTGLREEITLTLREFPMSVSFLENIAGNTRSPARERSLATALLELIDAD